MNLEKYLDNNFLQNCEESSRTIAEEELTTNLATTEVCPKNVLDTNESLRSKDSNLESGISNRLPTIEETLRYTVNDLPAVFWIYFA